MCGIVVLFYIIKLHQLGQTAEEAFIILFIRIAPLNFRKGRFKELLRGLTLQSSWGELACMKSGYPKLLMEHFDEAVQLFGEHVVLYGNQYRMGDVSDVQKYFVNFVASGSRTSKELYARLQSLERKRQETAENLYRYEQRIDGKRCYMGCPLPDDAPPRPSPKAIWNNLEAYWYEPAG